MKKLNPAPMPVYDFDSRQQRNVYLPDEDTFLLMDAVYNFCRIKPQSVLEIGPGSGVVITFLAKHFGPATYTAVDMNEEAVKMTNQTLQRNGFQANCVRGDLFQAG